MTQATFDIAIRRARVTHALDVVTFKLKFAGPWFVFAFWRASSGRLGRRYCRPWWSSTRGPCTSKLCFKQRELTVVVKVLSREISRSFSSDLVVHTIANARDVEEAALQCNKRALFGLMRHLTPWAPQRDFRLCDASGHPASSDAEECVVKRDHFNVVFSAHRSSLQDLIVSERDDAAVHSN